MSDHIKQIKLPDNETVYDISTLVGYGTCPTAAATAAKVVTIADTAWELRVGSIIGVKFTNTNSATSVTLNVNSTGAKNIYYNNAAYAEKSSSICGYANRTIYYMYDGTYWVWMNMGTLDGNSNTVPAVQCETAAGTAAKVGICTNHTLLHYSYVHVNVRYTNTYKGAITLNIDSAGAKPIYLNGNPTSGSNYDLKAGTYIAYYDGANFHFRTDGTLPGAIEGAQRALSADWAAVADWAGVAQRANMVGYVYDTSANGTYVIDFCNWFRDVADGVGIVEFVNGSFTGLYSCQVSNYGGNTWYVQMLNLANSYGISDTNSWTTETLGGLLFSPPIRNGENISLTGDYPLSFTRETSEYSGYAYICSPLLKSGTVNLTLPAKSGTFALTSDLEGLGGTIPTASANTLGGLYAKFDESTGTLYLSTTAIN